MRYHNTWWKLYVADSRSGQSPSGFVFVFKFDGQFCTSFGSDKLKSAYDVAVNVNNQLLVADFNASCISIFTLDGQYVSAITPVNDGTAMYRPNSVATDRNGFVFVTDRYQRVVIFDKYGNTIHSFDGSKEIYYVNCYDYYYTIAVDPKSNNVHFVDNYSKRIQIFSNY